MKLFGNFNKPIRLRKNILKTIVRLQGQSIHDKMSHNVVYLFSIYDEMSHNVVYLFSIYDEMSHNVVYLFSIYDEMSHNVVYLFSTPNLGNYQAEISPLALNQSKLLKYFQ